MGRRTARMAALIGIVLTIASCGRSNEDAMESALAKIEMESTLSSTLASAAPEITSEPAHGAATSTTTPASSTTTSSSTTPPSSTSSTTARKPTATAVAGVDHPQWSLVCAQDLGATPDLDRTSCAPFDPSGPALMTVPASDSLGCAAWLDNADAYDPDIGTDFYAVIMEPVGDGVGVHVDTWYPDDALPGDDMAIAWFSPRDILPDDDEFPSGQYICLTQSEVGWDSIEFGVRQDLDLEDWNPENLITVDIDYIDE